MIRFALPTVDDLIRLGEPHPNAVTVYLPTSPTPSGREQAFTAAKSAIDEAIRQLRGRGASGAVQDALRAQWDALADASSLWGNLSRSLAIFISPEVSEEFVLPNELEPQSQVGAYFDLGQLVRSVSSPQEAFALTLSSNGWNVWTASATARSSELELSEEYAADAADATNRMTIRGRQHLRRLVGDEGRKVLLERYSRTVADALRAELGQVDPAAARPLFVFATEPLLSMFQAEGLPWRLVPVPGSPDDLRPDQIDEAIRERIGDLTSATLSERADRIGDGLAAGLAATDLAEVAKAAASGAVDTLIYDFTVDILGTFDEVTGDVTFSDDGHDLLSRIAIAVLRHGGDLVAVRPDELTAQAWKGRLLAKLRHPLA